MERPTLPKMDVSSWWLQAVVLTFLFGFAILGYLAIIYQQSPPVPGRIVSDSGQRVFTENDIRAGQESFLTYGLMQYGSVYCHGAYLEPDFTADYLHRLAVEMRRSYGGYPEAGERVGRELRQNRYDPATDVLTWPDAQARAFEVLRQHYEKEVLDRSESGGGGLGPHAVPDPAVRRQIVAFVAWTSWTAAARRPNKPHSYTNNWPPEELVGNHLTEEAVVWSALPIGGQRAQADRL